MSMTVPEMVENSYVFGTHLLNKSKVIIIYISNIKTLYKYTSSWIHSEISDCWTNYFYQYITEFFHCYSVDKL